MEGVAPNTNCSRPPTAGNMVERRGARPQKEQNLNCPRCNSTNTKFCYYNNYSLTQPRYFCKTCRRYWTQGGSLRNVPVGGGSRKNKRSSSSTNPSLSSSATATSTSSSSTSPPKLMIPDLNPPTTFTQLINSHHHNHHHQNPSKNIHHQGQDLNLAFPTTHDYQGIFQPIEMAKIEINNSNNNSTSQAINDAPVTCSSAPTSSSFSALELLRSGMASRGLNPYAPVPMPDSGSLYQSGFPLQEFKPNLSYSGEGIGARVGSFLGVQDGARLLFPFGEMKQLSSTATNEADHQEKGSQQDQVTPGYWNGMLGGGTW